MKVRKSYRLSPRAIRALENLHDILAGWTETDIIEAALECLLNCERTSIQIRRSQEAAFRAEGREYWPPESDLAEAYDLPGYNDGLDY